MQWATTTTDNNYEATFNNDAPKTDYVANNLNNMNNVAIGTNTSTTLEEEVNYDYHAQPEETHQVQQQPVEEMAHQAHQVQYENQSNGGGHGAHGAFDNQGVDAMNNQMNNQVKSQLDESQPMNTTTMMAADPQSQ